MMLRKTTIIPTDDAALALKLMRQLIYEEAHVLMVVLGSDALAEQTVERADKLTGATAEPRWVAWLRKPELVQELLDELKVTKPQRAALKNAIACSLSLGDVVRDIVPRSPEPDMFRLRDAFHLRQAFRIEGHQIRALNRLQILLGNRIAQFFGKQTRQLIEFVARRKHAANEFSVVEVPLLQSQ